MTLDGKRILLIVSGGIAAYKCLEAIRLLRRRGVAVRCILTSGGAQFVTPLSLAALSEDRVHEDLFSLTGEHEMGHIQLSRAADLVVVAPASADILAKMASGLASGLATTVLLATDKPVMAAPAMNVRMWEHPSTQANIKTLSARGVRFIGPVEGDMACGEFGMGRLVEPEELVSAIEDFFQRQGRLQGRAALVTSGPTHEAIDPVRYIANRSSGKQGHAIAQALADMGAQTTLVSGPTHQPDPAGVSVVHVQSAREMLAACENSLPVDVAVAAAAVSDWRLTEPAASKIKKDAGKPRLELTENPDILASLSEAGNRRPKLVVGFAAETENVIDNGAAKRQRKGCDWIIANDVSPDSGTFGGEVNTVHLITTDGVDSWTTLSKVQVAQRLAIRIANALDPTLDPTQGIGA